LNPSRFDNHRAHADNLRMNAQPTTPQQEHGSPILPGQDWQTQRREILARVLALMGPFPAQRCALDMQTLSVTRDEKYPHVERRHIKFRAEGDDWITAFLLVPTNVSRPMPGVLCIHPTTDGGGKNECVGLPGKGGVFTFPDCAYGLELAALHGYVTLSIDLRFDGERVEPGSKPYVSSAFEAAHPAWSPQGKMTWDGMRSVDLLASLPEVDAKKIGVIGHSLGAINGLFTAAFDERITACVFNGGNVAWRYGGDFHWSLGERDDGGHWTYFPKARRFLEDKSIPYPWRFLELASTIAPRAAIYSATQGEADGQALPTFVSLLKQTYSSLGVTENIETMIYPGEHSFPDAARERGYALLNRVFRGAR
jgi:dienelactone hydrolase